ncbi:MAG: UDP-N-acetylmuramate dehydrogenase [Tannerella sp.]|jgi:UDP-N-acetylmuramate dehydrogenase|nr:UDP-N-acetylmuramate dehydrogenase [Tannerella sp.]
MRIEQNYPLDSHNTFHVPARTRWFMEYENEEDLNRILRDEYFQESRSLHIGEGSNLLFINDFNGIVLHSAIKGIVLTEDASEFVLLRVGAAERWDDVVAYAVSNGWGGVENLSRIPGETGAAAIQNIGAYGVEIKDVVETVETYNQLTFEKRIFTNEACRYSYRYSFFKENDHDPYIVTHVNIRLQKNPEYKLDYGNLKDALKDTALSLQAVRDAVTGIRRCKLPECGKLGNAGSFFMNPVISGGQFGELKEEYPKIPSYPLSDGRVKVPAGWLIEQCGLKGKKQGNVGIYDKQALIIVNYGEATGDEIATFAESIRQAVYGKFGISLVPEVRYVQ